MAPRLAPLLSASQHGLPTLARAERAFFCLLRFVSACRQVGGKITGVIDGRAQPDVRRPVPLTGWAGTFSQGLEECMEKKFSFNVLEGRPTARRSLLTEFDSEEQKTKYEELIRERQEMLDRFRKNIIEQPEKTFSNCLRMLLDDPDSMEKVAPSAVRSYQYVAKHLLRSIDGTEPTVTEYLTFEQFCINNTFATDGSIYFRMFNFDEDRPYDSIYEELLGSYLSNFQNSAATGCNMVYLGVPMYVAGPGEKMTEDRTSERYHFIKGMGKYFYSPDDRKAPEWMNGVYLKRSDIERHYLIFSQPEPPSPEEEAALVKAYRISLGLSVEEMLDHATSGFGTRLAQHASSMIRHFESQGYSRSRSGEWPLQKAIVFWLTSNSGLSNREAEAIDLVTRPDHLRTR